MSICDIAHRYLKVFIERGNRNTGNIYEFAFAFQILRKMGLTNDDFNTLSEPIKSFERIGKGNKGVSQAIDAIKREPVGSAYIIDGKKVVDLVNTTQADDIGTADIILIFEDGTKGGFSITEGSGKATKDGIHKVIRNAGVKGMQCTDEDIEKIKFLERSLTRGDKDKFREDKYGADRQKWPKRCKFPKGIEQQGEAARLIADRMTGFSDSQLREVMNGLLCISKLPADYIAYVNKKTFQVVCYRIAGLHVDKDNWVPCIKVDGVFLNTYCGDTLISKSQVKYNNGVGTSMRKVNIGAFMDKIFKLERFDFHS